MNKKPSEPVGLIHVERNIRAREKYCQPINFGRNGRIGQEDGLFAVNGEDILTTTEHVRRFRKRSSKAHDMPCALAASLFAERWSGIRHAQPRSLQSSLRVLFVPGDNVAYTKECRLQLSGWPIRLQAVSHGYFQSQRLFGRICHDPIKRGFHASKKFPANPFLLQGLYFHAAANRH